MVFDFGKTSVNLSFSFVALILLMLLLCEENIVLLSLISSFIHEGGHLFFMFISGVRHAKVHLGIFGMRIDKVSSSCISYKKEIFIALGGIIFNLIFALISVLIFSITHNKRYIMLCAVNIFIVIINSFPVSVLDMGTALKYFFLIRFDNDKTEKILEEISYVFVVIFLCFTVSYCVFIGNNISLIAVTVYLFSVTLLKKRS